MNSWHIDRGYLRKSITDGHKILMNPQISKKLKTEVKYDIKVFRNFLANKFKTSQNNYQVNNFRQL